MTEKTATDKKERERGRRRQANESAELFFKEDDD
jgi:hypothetical protein